VEVLRGDGRPAAPGEEGDIVVTDLLNRGMPLIRYRVGDVGVLSGKPCSCGRSLPILETVTGRSADFLVTPRGVLVAGVSLVERTLTAIPGLEQLQIIQEKIDEVVLNVVGDEAYSPETERALLREMRVALGDGVQLRIARISRIEQERNGKYRFAISKVQNAYQDVRP
jgi:phenylacetate-CoA ligase